MHEHRCSVDCVQHCKVDEIFRALCRLSKLAVRHIESDAAASNERLDAHERRLADVYLPSHNFCALHQTQHVCNSLVDATTIKLGCNVASRLYSIVLLLKTGNFMVRLRNQAAKCLSQSTNTALMVDQVTALHHKEFRSWLLASFWRAYAVKGQPDRVQDPPLDVMDKHKRAIDNFCGVFNGMWADQQWFHRCTGAGCCPGGHRETRRRMISAAKGVLFKSVELPALNRRRAFSSPPISRPIPLLSPSTHTQR